MPVKISTTRTLCLCNCGFLAKTGRKWLEGHSIRPGIPVICGCGCGQLTLSASGVALNHNKRRPLTDRFWEKVVVIDDANSCWLWIGGVGKKGYPILDGRTATRVAYEIQVGLIPDGLWVLHRCDNPVCCRGSHLFVGTYRDNIEDMIRKGRAKGHAINFSAALNQPRFQPE